MIFTGRTTSKAVIFSGIDPKNGLLFTNIEARLVIPVTVLMCTHLKSWKPGTYMIVESYYFSREGNSPMIVLQDSGVAVY